MISDDHFVCIANDTDAGIDQGVFLPFGDTGPLDDGGLLDDTGEGVIESSVAEPSENAGLGEFVRERTTRLPDGRFLFDGDVAVADHQVSRVYDRFRGSPRATERFRSTLGCRLADRRDDIWDRARLGSLTYCFGDFADSTLEAEVRSAVTLSAWEYELASDMNFVHLAHLDGASCNKNTDVVFIIRQGVEADCGIFGCPLAMAFFPIDAEIDTPRDVIIFPELLTNVTFEVKGVVQHELGHVLGLWHEHARFVQDDGVLSLDSELACTLSAGASPHWRGVTPPDSNSIMGYPYCRGTSRGSVELSPMDRLALRYMYALPALSRRSFDGDATADILWYLPHEGVLTMWYGSASGGVDLPLSFTEVPVCTTDGSGDCPESVRPNWKPVPLRMSGRSKVLMYGPGSTLDLLIETTSELDVFDHYAVPVGHETAVPRVGDLAGQPGSEDVLFILPGPGDGDWGLLEGLSSFMIYESIDGVDDFFDAAVGDFDPSEAAEGDQILWYSEGTTDWRMTSRVGNTLQDTAFVPCALPTGVPMNALVGNFDADDADEILWYFPEQELIILWETVEDCTADQVAFPLEDQPKPHPGDFDGDGRLDVLWDRPGDDDELWRFVDPAVPIISATTVPRDTIPLVGDFDADGCSDVLWYRGYAETSETWRSACDGTFVAGVVNTPVDAAPVGYHHGHGRAYRGQG